MYMLNRDQHCALEHDPLDLWLNRRRTKCQNIEECRRSIRCVVALGSLRLLGTPFDSPVDESQH